MAQVPNYYYNSPWIADAARNFASALAPPDPDKLRERDQKQFEFDYLKKKAGYEESDRQGNEVALGALGDLHKLRSAPIFQVDSAGNPLKDKDGKPVIDSDAMDRRAYELAGIVETNAKDRFIRADLDQAMYEASPKFRRQALIQKFGAAFAAQRLASQHDYRTDEIYTQGGVNSTLQAQEDAAAMERLQAGGAMKLQEWQLRANLVAKNKNTPPLTLTPALIGAVGMRFRQLERNARYPLSEDQRLKYTGEAMEVLQDTRNPVGAADEIWKMHGLSGQDSRTQEVPEVGSVLNWLIRLADPDFDPVKHPVLGQTDTVLQPTEQAVVPGSLGAASVTPPVDNPFIRRGKTEAEMEQFSRDAAAADNARLPPAGKKPAGRTPPRAGKGTGKKPVEGQRAKSKSGVPMVFHNGRWEAL